MIVGTWVNPPRVVLSDDENEVARICTQQHQSAPIAGNASELIDIIGAYQEAGLDELIFRDLGLPNDQQKFDRLDQFLVDVGSKFQ